MEDPLAPPESNELLDHFRALRQLREADAPRQQLRDVARAFVDLPYENLTKIIKDSETDSVQSARRSPREVLADYRRWRTGGTCFSLTATLLHLVRSLGLEAQPILADRNYGADTHCALIVWLDGQPHLLDPGYLIVEPIALGAMSNGLVVPTDFNQLEFVPRGTEQMELHTIQANDRRYRLTFKMSPVDEQQFRFAWEASFDWDMMHYPLLTKVANGQQLYMRSGHLQQRSSRGVRREEVPPRLWAQRMARVFGIHPEVIHKALAVLRRGGD